MCRDALLCEGPQLGSWIQRLEREVGFQLFVALDFEGPVGAFEGGGGEADSLDLLHFFAPAVAENAVEFVAEAGGHAQGVLVPDGSLRLGYFGAQVIKREAHDGGTHLLAEAVALRGLLQPRARADGFEGAEVLGADVLDAQELIVVPDSEEEGPGVLG